MDVLSMTEDAAATTINEICDGMKLFITNNPTLARDLLGHLVNDLLDPLSDGDYFGTQGWEYTLGAS